MAGFDTFVRAGGTGIDLPGIVNQAQVAKQNDLLNLQRQNAIAREPVIEARAAAQEARLQNQEDRLQNKWETIEQLRQGSRLLNYLDNETPDIKGAMAYISEGGITEKEKPVLSLLQTAMESGDLSQVAELRKTLIGLKKTALEMGDIEAQGGDANLQFASNRPVIGYTQSGKEVNGSMEIKRNPDNGAIEPMFVADVGSIDPSDPIVRTENVGRTGLTGEESNRLTAERMAEQQRLITGELDARKKADVATTRLTNFADSGLSSAEAYTTTKRSLDLLKGIETGGFEGVALRARQLFGIQAADEAELTTGMLRGVLAQLRPIFGAAFTAAEGNSLKAIEANIGKSTEGNRALLSQLLKIQERSAKRGAAAARKIGDDFTADEIEAQLQFDLSEGTPQEQNKPQAAGTPTQSDVVTVTTQEQYDALPSGAFYMEDGKTYRKP